MATTNKWATATSRSLMTTELNSLTTTGTATSVEIDNSANLELYGIFELLITYGSAPTANSTISIYVIAAPDGTNYSDSRALSTTYIGDFVLTNVTTAQRLLIGAGIGGPIVLPPTKFKVYLVANTTGQTAAASGNTLKLFAYNSQAV